MPNWACGEMQLVLPTKNVDKFLEYANGVQAPYFYRTSFELQDREDNPHTFEDKTNNKLGEFCADAGMVGVFLLSEVLSYNPQFDYHTERPWTTTLIKNFKGTVYIERTTVKKDKYIRVIGEGIDKVTGQPLCFHTEQTGF